MFCIYSSGDVGVLCLVSLSPKGLASPVYGGFRMSVFSINLGKAIARVVYMLQYVRTVVCVIGPLGTFGVVIDDEGRVDSTC